MSSKKKSLKQDMDRFFQTEKKRNEVEDIDEFPESDADTQDDDVVEIPRPPPRSSSRRMDVQDEVQSSFAQHSSGEDERTDVKRPPLPGPPLSAYTDPPPPRSTTFTPPRWHRRRQKHRPRLDMLRDDPSVVPRALPFAPTIEEVSQHPEIKVDVSRVDETGTPVLQCDPPVPPPRRGVAFSGCCLRYNCASCDFRIIESYRRASAAKQREFMSMLYEELGTLDRAVLLDQFMQGDKVLSERGNQAIIEMLYDNSVRPWHRANYLLLKYTRTLPPETLRFLLRQLLHTA